LSSRVPAGQLASCKGPERKTPAPAQTSPAVDSGGGTSEGRLRPYYCPTVVNVMCKHTEERPRMTDAVGGGEDEGKLVWLIGLYALAVGGALIVLAFRVRGPGDERVAA
jgi:hypothetical protein